MNQGRLIVVEGTDGAGKTTQAKRLVHYLKSTGYRSRYLREPTDGPHGREIRRLAREGRRQVTPEEELELFIQDRLENCKKNIRPSLEAGEVVILDRYYFSTIAYQGALGLDIDIIRKRNEDIAVIPDLVFILEVPVEKGLSRITHQRGDVHDDFEQADFLRHVREIFLSMDAPYIRHLNADRDTDEVFGEIRKEVDRLLINHIRN